MAADYRLLDTVDCIFVETAVDDGGYVERYWVSVNDGLLCASEKLQGEDVVYRMAGMTIDTTAPDADVFTLPDGTVLHGEQTNRKTSIKNKTGCSNPIERPVFQYVTR